MRIAEGNVVVGHRFAKENMVRLSRAMPRRNAVPGTYEVLALLSERDGEFQYRIRSEREPYMRIVKSSSRFERRRTPNEEAQAYDEH